MGGRLRIGTRYVRLKQCTAVHYIGYCTVLTPHLYYTTPLNPVIANIAQSMCMVQCTGAGTLLSNLPGTLRSM